MQTIIVRFDNQEKLDAFKVFATTLKISFEIMKEKSYNPEFVAKIQKSREDLKAEKGISITLEELEELCK